MSVDLTLAAVTLGWFLAFGWPVASRLRLARFPAEVGACHREFLRVWNPELPIAIRLPFPCGHADMMPLITSQCTIVGWASLRHRSANGWVQ